MKSLTVEIICNDLPQALSLQSSIIEVAGLSGANVESTSIDSDLPIQINWDGIDIPEPEAPKPPEGQDDTPDFVENWDTTVVQRSSELPAGEGKPLPASKDIIDAAHEIAVQYRDSLVEEYSESAVVSVMLDEMAHTSVRNSDDLNYYIGVIDTLHRVELRENNKRGLKHTDDAIYEALKAEHPHAVKTLRM